ncbi:hydrogenase 4 subunit F [Dendrosporobacter sp. 1207_IL3150]|uniref:hydrogenase 4 subunit F n=1 Tax=Dendrosporobacter sp. 1207_IL3150 TaxID=3084054 RepID=UPI002FD90BEF
MVLVAVLFLAPLITGLFAWVAQSQRFTEKLQAVGALATLAAAGKIASAVYYGGAINGWHDIIYIDALSAFNIFLIALIGFAASLYSIGYMRHELAEGEISFSQLRFYYLFYHLFIFTMLTVSAVNSLGLLWVGIELTTLVSALLVAFYGKNNALEAAWKYLIMGSVGIAFALLGIIFVYLSGIQTLGQQHAALNWTELLAAAKFLNPSWIKIGFIFILIGFGTKAGLAPMHFWLPDAHSQAPTPISAVLSGVLLNTALYGLFRVYAIANTTLNGEAAQYLIFFGLFSIAITVPFIMIQHDLKRMLAYSSVEHMGIITLSVGIGGTLGLYGAFLHMFNHSMAKSLLFFAAGTICQKYHTKQMGRITGILKSMPVTGTIFLIAAFAITGAPPFNIFLSEITIMMAGFKSNQTIVSVILIVLITIIFAGMMHYIIKMVFGESGNKVERIETSNWSTVALIIPLILVVICGWYVPPLLDNTIYKVSTVLQGGVR